MQFSSHDNDFTSGITGSQEPGSTENSTIPVLMKSFWTVHILLMPTEWAGKRMHGNECLNKILNLWMMVDIPLRIVCQKREDSLEHLRCQSELPPFFWTYRFLAWTQIAKEVSISINLSFLAYSFEISNTEKNCLFSEKLYTPTQQIFSL